MVVKPVRKHSTFATTAVWQCDPADVDQFKNSAVVAALIRLIGIIQVYSRALLEDSNVNHLQGNRRKARY